jgi:hypothetical protein
LLTGILRVVTAGVYTVQVSVINSIYYYPRIISINYYASIIYNPEWAQVKGPLSAEDQAIVDFAFSQLAGAATTCKNELVKVGDGEPGQRQPLNMNTPT